MKPGRDARVPRAGEDGALDLYLDQIRSIPVLSRAKTIEWAERRVAHEGAFRKAVCSLAATARISVARWAERRRDGFVTGVLAAGYRDGRGPEWSARIDETLGAVAVLLSRRDAVGAGSDPARARAALDRAIARRLADADLSLDFLLQVHAEIEVLVRAPDDDRAATARRRELGLHTRAARARFDHSCRALCGREEAVNALVRHNLKLVVKFAKRYRGLGVGFMDLIQEGNLGLVRAAEKYDPTRGFTFSTYGVWWIEQAVIRAIQNQSRTVRVPAHIYDRQLRYRAIARSLRQQVGRDPTRAELASALDASPAEVDLIVATTQRIRSTQERVPGTDDLCFEDTLTDDSAPDALDAIDAEELRGELEQALRCLRPRERQILAWRFGLWDGEAATLEEIGQQIGLSRERVRQIQAAALARLRGRDRVARLAASIGLPLPETE